MGTLYIVATPIGNLEDISIRALRTIFSVNVIACEDTRRTGFLLSELKKRYQPILRQFTDKPLTDPRLMRYDDRTEHQSAPEVLALLMDGTSVALLSDAGTPLINDPGYILVREARKKGIAIVSIPGASAILTSLVESGLPADKFVFLGYPPEKQAHRTKLFQALTETSRLLDLTYIFYASPHKLDGILADMLAVFGDREVTVARELTKKHEEIWTGPLSGAAIYFADPKGEFVLLIRLSA